MKENDVKQTKKKKKRSILWLLPILFAVILLTVAGILIYTLIPSKTRVTREAYFGVSENTTAVVYNQDILSNITPVSVDGHWYLSFSDLYYTFCRYFYYDGNYLLYTDPLQTFRAAPGENSYTGDDGRVYSLDYAPCMFKDGGMLISLEYTQLMNYTYFSEEEQNYLWIQDDFGTRNRAKVLKEEAVRTQGRIKAEIVCDMKEGDEVSVLSADAGWSFVQTDTGLTGYMRTNCLDTPQEKKTQTPDGRPLPVYANISMDEPVVMGWHYLWKQSGYNELSDILKKAKGMNVICPKWLTIKNNTGEIWNFCDKKYVDEAHKAGVQVWVMLDDVDTNDYDDSKTVKLDETVLFGTTGYRKNLISKAVSAVKEVGADGINLDVERVKSDDGPGFLQFIRELSAACRTEGLVLSVDNYSPMEHTRFYDRRQQGIIVDYVVVMAYDEHYAGDDDAGSTSSVGWVEQSTERTIEWNGVPQVPHEKVIVGLPLYTRLWCETKAVAGAEKAVDNSSGALDSKYPVYTLTSKGLNMEGQQAKIEEEDLKLTWLDKEKQYYTEYQEGDSWYRMWVEDTRSMACKLDKALSYKPGGIAFFSVGHEDKAIWSVVRSAISQ